MPSEWRLQDAKNNLNLLIRKAASGEAQVVSVHGKPAAVVVSAEAYDRLTRQGQDTLSTALLQPGLASEDLDFARSPDTGRNVDPSPS
jgi:antitoxin Phd